MSVDWNACLTDAITQTSYTPGHKIPGFQSFGSSVNEIGNRTRVESIQINCLELFFIITKKRMETIANVSIMESH
jgi:hypothetical protein